VKGSEIGMVQLDTVRELYHFGDETRRVLAYLGQNLFTMLLMNRFATAWIGNTPG